MEVILILTVPVVMASIVLFYVWRTIRRSSVDAQARAADYQQRYARAVWAGATVISLRESRVVESQALVRADLRLLVRPSGSEPCQATATWRVPVHLLASLQPGQEISVRIDSRQPERIYPNITGVSEWVV